MCLLCCQEEDEVPDDETVNQMIARSEEEFDQFMVRVPRMNRSSRGRNSSADLLVSLPSFSPSSSLSAWTWTAVARTPVTLGENRV